MPSTKSFTDLVQRRAARDPDFTAALLREGARMSYRSPLMASIHETAEGLHAAVVMNKKTMCKFNKACLTPARPSSIERETR
jgi:hypothetical protein